MTFTDETNTQHTALAVVGKGNVHLLEGRGMGLCPHTTPQGRAAKWLKDAVFAALADEAPAKGKK